MTYQTRRTWVNAVSMNSGAWTVEIAPHKGNYALVTTEDWFSDAWCAYRDLEVINGATKVLKRNGVVVHRTVSARSIGAPKLKPVRYEQELLPIAL